MSITAVVKIAESKGWRPSAHEGEWHVCAPRASKLHCTLRITPRENNAFAIFFQYLALGDTEPQTGCKFLFSPNIPDFPQWLEYFADTCEREAQRQALCVALTGARWNLQTRSHLWVQWKYPSPGVPSVTCHGAPNEPMRFLGFKRNRNEWTYEIQPDAYRRLEFGVPQSMPSALAMLQTLQNDIKALQSSL